LVAYWPFNASAGDTVADASENGHDGALVGPNRVSAKIGNGLEVRGAAVVEIANSPKLNFDEDQSMTITVWALWPEQPADNAWIVGKAGHLPAHYLFGYHTSANGLRVKLDDGGTDLKLDTQTNVYDGIWHHLAVVRDRTAGMAAIYIDGNRDVEADDGTQNMTNDAVLTIGQRGDDTEYLPNGVLIDELAIWDEALDDATLLKVMDGSLLAAVLAVEPSRKLATTWGGIRDRM
jgi:hypothetical protein